MTQSEREYMQWRAETVEKVGQKLMNEAEAINDKHDAQQRVTRRDTRTGELVTMKADVADVSQLLKEVEKPNRTIVHVNRSKI